MVKSGYTNINDILTCLDPEITFTYQAPEENDLNKYETIRDSCKTLAKMILKICPDNHERMEAYFLLQNVMTKANASIAVDRGVKRNAFNETKK